MKKVVMKKILGTVLLCLIVFLGFCQTTYYVSNTGNDASAGTSQATAWKTLTKVNLSTFNPGDSILLKRGDSWREQYIKMPSQGLPGNRIAIGSYGTGNKPQLIGSKRATGWTNVTGNIWKSTNKLRDPTYGTNHNGSVSAVDENLNTVWAGGSWFINLDSSITWGNQEKTSQAELLAEYDWWWNTDSSIYVYSPTNPTTRYRGMEVSQIQKGFDFNNKSYLTIDGLQFNFFGFQGIGLTPGLVAGDHKEVLIQNCNVGYIGLKDGASMGIQFYHANSIIKGNTVHDCGRRGIVLNNGIGLMQNVLFEGNTMYSGSHTTGIDIQVVSNAGFTRDITIKDNVMYDDPQHVVGPPTNAYPVLLYVSEQSNGSGKISNIKIHNNIFMYPVQSAMGLENIDSAYIYNNTIYGSNQTINQFGFGIGFGGVKTNNIKIKNNIFYSNSDSSLNRQASALIKGSTTPNSNIESNYNLFYEVDPRVILINWGDGSQWYNQNRWADYKTATGQDLNSINPTNPLFISPTNLRLQPSSPAIDAGVNVGLSFNGAAPDIGAYESSLITERTGRSNNLKGGTIYRN